MPDDPSAMSMLGGRFDPVQLEVLWSRLVSIVEEAETTLVRTSFSPTVGEADDHAAALLDARGQILAQSPSGMPGFVAVLGRLTRKMLEYFPPATLEPGDTLITNDPWICAGHLPDINLLTPIFYRNHLVAFASNTAHLSDIGGRGSPESVDLFEEGLRIPPSKLYRAGTPNEDVFNFIRANSRTPKQISGDLLAQHAANAVASRRVLEMIEEHRLSDLEELSNVIQEHTERAMRRVIVNLPDGEYRGEVVSDGYDDPIVIRVRVTICGPDVTVDYTGTSPQVERGINSPFNYTYSHSMFPFRCIAPHVPMTEGALRPIHVIAPEGSALNPRFPAPVMRRTVTVHNVYAAIFQALAPLVPEHLAPGHIVAHGGGIWGFWVRGAWGTLPRAYKCGFKPVENNFSQMYLFNGGQGATGDRDGQDTLSMPDNCANIPIEVCEYRAPILFVRKEYTANSGGPGRYRGGCGQRVEILVLAEGPMRLSPASLDRLKNPPFGLLGGCSGARGRFSLNDTALHPRKLIELRAGDRITLEAPGGGGAYRPEERDPEAVEADVAEGLVSEDCARTVYRVVIENGGVDGPKTQQLRNPK